jgi:hypothetical protein
MFQGYSVEQSMKFLTALNFDPKILILSIFLPPNCSPMVINQNMELLAMYSIQE